MEPLWERLRVRYFKEWLKAQSTEWHDIKAKLNVIDDVRAELRTAANKRD